MMPLKLLTVIYFFCVVLLFPAVPAMAQPKSHQDLVATLSSFADRSTGSPGNDEAADFIYHYFKQLGLSPQRHAFAVPVRTVQQATIHHAGKTAGLQPFLYNAITPQGIDGSLEGPLFYVGTGALNDFNGKPVQDSIILMDFDSGLNWQTAAKLGAKAAILVDRGTNKGKHFFEEKLELSPLQFPIFYMSEAEAASFFDNFSDLKKNDVPLADSTELRSTISWQEVVSENIYTFIEGSDPELAQELLIVEAFYDTSSFLPGVAPGADEATSIVTLLKTAEALTRAPPGRSVLLLATSGHSQTLAGVRDIIWAMQAEKKEITGHHKLLQKDIANAQANLEELSSLDFPLPQDKERDSRLVQAIKNTLQSSIDEVSRELVHLRLSQQQSENKTQIAQLVDRRFALRQLSWKTRFDDLSFKEINLFQDLLPDSMAEQEKVIRVRQNHLETLQSAIALREALRDYSIAAIVSLHLSSHGTGVGGFHEGWLYQLKANINRTGIYAAIGDILRNSAQQSTATTPYIDSLQPSRMRSWDTWFLGSPFHGGEVSSLAGYLGFTLATVGDSRHLWGTPWDTPAEINWTNLIDQQKLISTLVSSLSHAEKLSTGKMPRNGFSTITGRANLLLQGELFAEYPAQNTTIMAFQGKGRFYAMVDTSGTFFLKGVADRKNVVDKVIIEGYRFDDESGKVKWAIDKKETGKDNYRLKIRRANMKTDLILFSATQTTIFGLLEPRNFNYLTKIDLLDGRRDAPPAHYWYSRIDTRASTITSIYTEPGTWLKLTLSDTVLTRKLLLSNSTPKSPIGFGYPVDKYSTIPNTSYHAARDIWALLQPRIDNLEEHGIIDPQINTLKKQGLEALDKSSNALAAMQYDTFQESALQALALAGRVYVQVEKTQKDVLFGVLFYIALFVPFAFCLERFLFNYANIYKRIVAFTGLLLALITIIYNVHPAFELAYSPMVVVLAFFIIGLSLMVTLIIFFRFEEEMILLQRHASHKRPSEISHWKAFVAAFFLGVSNLRRRRLRTILTCLTLIILTFTIMSFTTVKSSRKANKLLFQAQTPYAGLLLKSFNWQSLPRQAETALSNNEFGDRITTARIWLEGRSMTRPVQVPLYNNGRHVELQGLIGMTPREKDITGLDTVLTSGRWFVDDDRYAILLEENTAARLGLGDAAVNEIFLWGIKFTVIGTFAGSRFDTLTDLDGEPLTPVTFPQETSTEISETEQEALEAGDDVRSMQSRYRHTPAHQIAIIPAGTLYAMGGALKSVAVKPSAAADVQKIAPVLVERFSLPLFAGDKDGVWFFSPSDTLSYSGVPNILIPLILSIFIVLNTMISSVYERKNEIAVYTSVGLAPSHVSFLFIAEAMALAVISVVLGYLLAQVSAALFSTTPYWAGITVNYSSLAGVAAMLLVIVVVLVSVIYPSRVAAKIAIPDVKQTFKLPAPIHDRIEIILPFFMKYEEHESIGGFIYSYLSGHQDISHGKFSTGPVDIIFSCATVDEIKEMVLKAAEPSALNCMHIQAKVWLAPFDFGIMQMIDIQFCPAREETNYLEIKITFARKSGEVGMWQRVNTLFLHDLRKQLLIWRSLDEEGHASYEKILQNAVAESDTPVSAFQE